MLGWLLNLFRVPDLYISLDRAQWEERVERRARLNLELAGQDAQDCMARVRRRMLEGDGVWIAPRYNAKEAYVMWRRRHRQHRRINVIAMPEERQA